MEGGHAKNPLKSSSSVRLSLVFSDGKHVDGVNVGIIGRGYNILDGTVMGQLFQNISAIYSPIPKSMSEQQSHFKNYEEYEREMAQRVKLKSFEDGMWSLYCSDKHHKNSPLPRIEKMNHYQHFLFEMEERSYSLDLEGAEGSLPSLLSNSEDVQYILTSTFNKATRERYYRIFDKFGTHFITNVKFGTKATLVWSVKMSDPEDTKDPIGNLTELHRVKGMFTHAVEQWKASKFSDEETKKKPKGCFELKSTTDNFGTTDAKTKQVGFCLREISDLFSGSARAELELAIKCYLKEMGPIRQVKNLRDGATVALYCLDMHDFVWVDDHGHLRVNPPSTKKKQTQLRLSNKFEVKLKGKKIGLKAVKYGRKFVSRALTQTVFHFHRLQFMGPHESFKVNGDYLMTCANFHSPNFMHISSSDYQLHYSTGQDESLKNRVVLLDATIRAGDDHKDEEGEPVYMEDDENVPFHITVASNLKKSKDPLKNLKSLHDIPKSNSTSSLFIKDTISLPNIDELTRRLSFKLREMIELGHKMEPKKFLDGFSEETKPLTHSVPSFEVPPSVETIYHFVNTIFKVEKLHAEPGIMCYLYLKRFLEKTKLTLHSSNWRRVVVACIILASKVWEDLAVWNVDFIELFPNITVKDLNKMERLLLSAIDFTVTISASEYVKSFFELSQYADVERSTDTRPLDEDALKRLEVKSAASEKEYFKMKKSVSLSNIHERNNEKPEKQKKGIGILS